MEEVPEPCRCLPSRPEDSSDLAGKKTQSQRNCQFALVPLFCAHQPAANRSDQIWFALGPCVATPKVVKPLNSSLKKQLRNNMLSFALVLHGIDHWTYGRVFGGPLQKGGVPFGFPLIPPSHKNRKKRVPSKTGRPICCFLFLSRTQTSRARFPDNKSTQPTLP